MEDAYLIKGGKPLTGEIILSGAKNVALKVIISALFFDGKVILNNIPRINDVYELLHLITLMGGRAQFIKKNTIIIDGKNIQTNKVDLLHASKIRVSFMFFAPLLYKFKTCFVPNPGGCRIGARPIDRIIEGMKAIGLKIKYDSETGYYKAEVHSSISGSYSFNKPSHTGTELLMLIGLMTDTEVVIKNSALEPEIDELIRFLNSSGANIVRNNMSITIKSGHTLKQKNAFTIMSDRNEAVTYATLALATKGNVVIKEINKYLIQKFIEKVIEIGGGFEEISSLSFRFYYKQELKTAEIQTEPYPGFMTDWQQNWVVLMTQANGDSVIHERVFENRFSFVDELNKLGAEIKYITPQIQNPSSFYFFNFDPSKKYSQAVQITGPKKLHSGALTIHDLRAGATLAIAAFCADGESVINGASILERGYEDFVEKTTRLGGEIKKI